MSQTSGLFRSLLRTKSIEQSIADAAEPGHQLKRSLSAFDLMILGVAVAASFRSGRARRATSPGRR